MIIETLQRRLKNARANAASPDYLNGIEDSIEIIQKQMQDYGLNPEYQEHIKRAVRFLDTMQQTKQWIYVTDFPLDGKPTFVYILRPHSDVGNPWNSANNAWASLAMMQEILLGEER
jgi:hypothetical protein